MNPKTLYYFTESFPYGLGETWKLNELNVLVNEFDKIYVIPLYYHGNENNPKILPSKIIVHKPLLGVAIKKLNWWSFSSILDNNFFYYLHDFFDKKIYNDKNKIIKWLLTIGRIKKLLKQHIIKEMIKENNPNCFYYFFWGIGSADIVPFINKNFKKKIIVRMHRFDLFEGDVGGYIPFRSSLINHTTLIAPSSKAGEKHLKELYPKFSEKIHVRMLGVYGIGRNKQIHDNVLRIVTVSYIVPVKRLNILANSLIGITENIEWTHLGDGPLRHELEIIIQKLPQNVKVNLMGMIDSTAVQNILIHHPFNLFLNISESEGVPFSIMEALSAGIPVMATDVGGTAEIIDDTTGRLLPKELTPVLLQQELINYHQLPKEEKEIKANNAFNRYLTCCNTETLTKKIANELKELV